MAGLNIFTELPNGRMIPRIGLGTWQSTKGEVRDAVLTAIDCGYRHIDTAVIYGNHKEVGEAIKAKIDDGTVKREDLFVTTKLWLTSNYPTDVEGACRACLKDLGLDYIDLFLAHWPMTMAKDKGPFQLDKDGFLYDTEEEVDYVDTWKAMEPLVDQGLTRAIGVSNYNIAQMQRILDLPPKHPLATNQVESHPLLAQNELIEFCKKHKITVTAYSPLGSPQRPSKGKPDDPVMLEDPVVRKIAESKGKTPAQILIAFQLHRDVIVIPKSVTPSRIQQNFEALKVVLTAEELKQLANINQGFRYLNFPMATKMKHYPFAAKAD